MATSLRAIPDQLFQQIFIFLDSCTLYRLLSVSRWFLNAIAASESLWRFLMTERFPRLVVNAPSRSDYYNMHRQIDQNKLQLFRFGGIPSPQQYSHDADSTLRIPFGYKSIRSIACGGFFFAVHTTGRQLIIYTDRQRHYILSSIDEYCCGRSCLLYRSGPDWYFRRYVITYHSRTEDIKLPSQIKAVATGWENAVFVTGSNTLHLMVAENEQIWNIPIDLDLVGCGESNVVVVNKSGLFQSGYEEQSWSLLYSFKPNQKPIRLKVWFRWVALQTNQGWIVKLPHTDSFVELPENVRDVHLGDWHYVYILANGEIWSGGDYCRGGNLGAQGKPVASAVAADWLQDGVVLEYSCGGWQTMILYLDKV